MKIRKIPEPKKKGAPAEAVSPIVQAVALDPMVPVFALIHPTKGRPAKARAAKALYFERAFCPSAIEHVFVCDSVEKDVQLGSQQGETVVIAETQGSARAVNAGAAATKGLVIVVMADDVEPPELWDEKVLKALNGIHTPKVLATSDGFSKDRRVTHPILTRARWEYTDKRVFYPAYHSLWADGDLVTEAYNDKVVIEARGLVFKHCHPANGFGKPDATYENADDMLHHETGRDIFYARWGQWRER